jgi:hypothetical protein
LKGKKFKNQLFTISARSDCLIATPAKRSSSDIYARVRHLHRTDLNGACIVHFQLIFALRRRHRHHLGKTCLTRLPMALLRRAAAAAAALLFLIIIIISLTRHGIHNPLKQHQRPPPPLLPLSHCNWKRMSTMNNENHLKKNGY